jgi:hypothetical protein
MARERSSLRIGFGLSRPECVVVQVGELGEPVAKRGSERVLLNLADPRRECLGTVKREDLTAAGLRVERVREASLRAGRLVGERQRSFDGARHPVRQTIEVLRRLPFDPGERRALRLGLDHADGLAIDEEEIVGSAVRRLEDEFAHRHAGRGSEVYLPCVLNSPAGRLQHLVDLDPGLVLRRQVRLHRHNSRSLSSRFLAAIEKALMPRAFPVAGL